VYIEKLKRINLDFLLAIELNQFKNVSFPLSISDKTQFSELQKQLSTQVTPQPDKLYKSLLDKWPELSSLKLLNEQLNEQKNALLTFQPDLIQSEELSLWLDDFVNVLNKQQHIMFGLTQHKLNSASEELNNIVLTYVIYALILILIFTIYVWFQYAYFQRKSDSTLDLLDEKDSALKQSQHQIEEKDSALLKKREDLALSELRRETINQLLPVGMMLVNQEGNIIEVNQETCHLFGYSEQELIGMPVDLLVPEAKRADHDKLRQSFSDNAKPRIMAANDTDLSGQCKDGSLIPLEIGLAPVQLGADRYMLATLLNVKERREAMESLKQKNIEMDLALEKLRQSNEQLERFAFVCSHDLQEPVRMVLSFSQLLKKKAAEQLDEKSLGYLGHITSGAERAREMISDILTFCRLDQVTNAYETFELSELCEQIYITLKPSLEEKNAEFTWPDTLPSLVGVKSQVFQLVMNLVSNGVKFNRTPHPKVVLSLNDNQDFWQIRITDNGIGIDPKYFHKLFHVFGRLNAKSDFPGSGVGLAICKKIVDQHSGGISIDSQPNQGTTFIINWPKLHKNDTPSPSSKVNKL
jgi:PAS domain S-box-containing protein